MIEKEVKELIFFLPIVLGIVFAYRGVCILKKATDSKTWPSSSGKVISSEVDEEIKSTRSGRSIHYTAQISYEYFAKGNRYTGNRVFWGESSSTNRNRIQKIVNSYSPGKDVVVHYAPDNPGIAVLETGANWRCYFIVIFGVVLTVIGILGLVNKLKQ